MKYIDQTIAILTEVFKVSRIEHDFIVISIPSYCNLNAWLYGRRILCMEYSRKRTNDTYDKKQVGLICTSIHECVINSS